MKKSLLGLLLVLAASLSSAQEACRIPDELKSPALQKIDCVNKIEPDHYALALSWSPQHCSTVDARSKKHRFQCSLNDFGFVVHGLWGQNSQARNKCEQPRNCARSVVSDRIVRENICVMPGVELIQGQWQKHGTCTDMTAAAYFEKTRELWVAIKKPDLDRLLDDKDRTTAGRIVRAFVEANKESGLFEEAVAVQVARKNFLKEVFICYDLEFRYRRCSVGKTPANQTVRVVPR